MVKLNIFGQKTIVGQNKKNLVKTYIFRQNKKNLVKT